MFLVSLPRLRTSLPPPAAAMTKTMPKSASAGEGVKTVRAGSGTGPVSGSRSVDEESCPGGNLGRLNRDLEGITIFPRSKRRPRLEERGRAEEEAMVLLRAAKQAEKEAAAEEAVFRLSVIRNKAVNGNILKCNVGNILN